MVVFCWRSGLIGFGRRTPRGALELAKADGRRLRSLVTACARHARDSDALLVPGIPEANGDVAALRAARTFRDAILKRLAHLRAAP